MLASLPADSREPRHPAGLSAFLEARSRGIPERLASGTAAAIVLRRASGYSHRWARLPGLRRERTRTALPALPEMPRGWVAGDAAGAVGGDCRTHSCIKTVGERAMQRCGAKTRSGEPCKSWAVRDGAGGRCRMHGGTHRKGREAPAFKHGLYSKYCTPEDLAEFEAWQERGGIKGREVPAELEWAVFRCLRALGREDLPPATQSDVTNKLADALLKLQKYRGDDAPTKIAGHDGGPLPAAVIVGDATATDLACQLLERAQFCADDARRVGGSADAGHAGAVAAGEAPGEAQQGADGGSRGADTAPHGDDAAEAREE